MSTTASLLASLSSVIVVDPEGQVRIPLRLLLLQHLGGLAVGQTAVRRHGVTVDGVALLVGVTHLEVDQGPGVVAVLKQIQIYFRQIDLERVKTKVS